MENINLNLTQSTRRSYGERASSLRSASDSHAGKAGRRGRRGRGGQRRGHRAGRRGRELKHQRLAKTHLRICFWNCGSARQRGEVLERLVYESDIILLQETRCEADKFALKVTGYVAILDSTKHGQAILIKKDIKATEIDLKQYSTDNVQLQGICVTHNNAPLNIINVYACNNCFTHDGDWDFLSKICVNLHGEILFCGDFNARGASWGNVVTNMQGLQLENQMLGMDLLCINDGQATRLSLRAGDSDSVIDLTLASPGLVGSDKFSVLGHHGSDHLPCCVLLHKGRATKPTKSRTRAFMYPKTVDNSSSILDKLRNNRKKGTERKTFTQPPWWNDTVEEAWLAKRKAAKEWQRLRRRLGHQHESVKEAGKKGATVCRISRN